MSKLSLALALGLAGCAVTAPDDGELTVLPGSGDFDRSTVIYGGSAPDAAYHDAVVALHQLTSDGRSVYVSPFCSGTLVEDDVVVTAAHCVDVARRRARSFTTMDPALLAIYVGDDPSVDIIDHLYAVSEIEIQPAYDRLGLTDDIALVRLASPITESVSPVPNLPAASGFTSSDIGGTVNFAGFGVTESGDSGVKLQVDNELGGLGCSVPYCPGAGDSATQVSYSQTDGAGPCSGDSGGPLFIARGGTTYLGGVTSYGDSYCLYYGVSTRVDAYEDWIAAFVGTSTGDGGAADGGAVDGGASDGGASDGGATGDSCGDGVCDADESCDGRSGTTACEADCPGKTTGKPTLRYCYVGDSCEGPGCP